MLPYAFETVDRLKARLSIKDELDDSALQEILNGTAGAIEAAAGRTLRREHSRTEYFTGGANLIRVGVAPVANVESVRESMTRDFETAGAYEQLVEGTDYVLYDVPGRRPGECGMLRRLRGTWPSEPGSIRVVYTGGYKSDEELGLENGTIDLTNTDGILDFAIVNGQQYTYENSESDEIPFYLLDDGEEGRAFLRFDLTGSQRLLPCWAVLGYTLSVYLRRYAEALSVYPYILVADPANRGQLQAVFDSPLAPGAVSAGSASVSSGTFGLFTFTTGALTSGAGMLAMTATAKAGFVALGFRVTPPVTSSSSMLFMASSERTSMRPSLSLSHGTTFSDPYRTPDDLRHANLLQAVHEYQTRKTPGLISQFARGSASASGGGWLKQVNALLPEVQAIADRYRRIY